MATLSSRRKQAKPQRLNEEEEAQAAQAAKNDVTALFFGASTTTSSPPPMDLSTKKGDSALGLFDGKGMLSTVDPAAARMLIQQMLAQMNGAATTVSVYPPSSSASTFIPASLLTPTVPSEGEGVVMPTTSNTLLLPATPAATNSPQFGPFVCPSELCTKIFASMGALSWHVQEAHCDEELVECERCGARSKTRKEFAAHACPFAPGASSSARAATTSPPVKREEDEDERRSLPGSIPGHFRIFDTADSLTDDDVDVKMELDDSPLEAKGPSGGGFSLLSQLFNGGFKPEPGTSGAMDLSTPTPAELLSTRLPIPPHAFSSSCPPPPQFMMRSPFGAPPGETIMTPSGPVRADALNNEDDWESLMEVSTTDEAEKIRALVGDKALPPEDPNQCILCRRVLSCKSALQMHYRTHTGERPFKCKICQRAFTTKGNLKTHMGVHRAKHPYRPMPGGMPHPSLGPAAAAHLSSPMNLPQQQCPICQKRFITVPQLQSHIAEHTQQLRLHGERAKEESSSSSTPPSAPPPPPRLPLIPPPGMAGFPFLPFFTGGSGGPPTPMALAQILAAQHKMMQQAGIGDAFLDAPSPLLTPTKMKDESPATPPPPPPPVLPPPSSTVTLEGLLKPDRGLGSSISPGASSDGSAGVHDQTDGSSISHASDSEDKEKATATATATVTLRDEIIQTPDTVAEKSGANPLDAMKKMWDQTEPPPPRPTPTLSKHQCAVCYKHFSSSSALQIHMRTHTGDKPFKCDVCGRAFTTRGNLKVHMGTHMWQQSPSRRGRRIFEPTLDGASPPALPGGLSLTPSLAAQLAALSGGLLPGGPAPMATAPLAPASPMEVLMMTMNAWRTTCVVCQKSCSTQQELMDHLKEHNGSASSSSVTVNGSNNNTLTAASAE